MKISDVPSASANNGRVDFGTPESTRMQDIRVLRMRTDANPTVYQGPEQAQLQNLPPAQYSQSNTADQPEAKEPISSQYAAFAKQKRALQVKERALMEREKALQSQSQSGEMISLADLKTNPYRALRKLGITDEQITQDIYADQGFAGSRDLEAKINSLQEDFNKRLEERDQQAEQQTWNSIQDEVRELANSDDFELVRETKSMPRVMELMKRTWQETGVLMPVEEAMQDVENWLLSYEQKLRNTKKVQSSLIPQNRALPVQSHQGMRTLTNRDTAQVSLSAKQRALLAFRGELK